MAGVQLIGIVTVTYNSASVLADFLASVWKQTHKNFLLYIVDSGSTDGTAGWIRGLSDPRVRLVLREENIGFAAGSNLGISMALEEGCEAVMLLNNDTVFGPELFQQLWEGLKTYQCDMITPKMLYYDPPNKISAAGGHLNKWLGYRNRNYGEGQLDDGRFDHPRRITFTPFCCVLIRSFVFSKIGYLDEEYFVYVEDVDYCYRAMKAGIVMGYLPHCKLWHKISSLTGGKDSTFSIEYGTRNRIYYMFKNLSMPSAIFWTAVYGSKHYIRRVLGIDANTLWGLKLKAMSQGASLGRSLRPSTRLRK